MGEPHDRRVVPLLVALVVAGLTVKALVHGNYCLVPSTFLKAGEVGTAETSVYGIALYRAAGTDHLGMYREAVWWYETALLAEWAAAVAVGAGVYLVVRWWRGHGRAAPSGQLQTPNHCSATGRGGERVASGESFSMTMGKNEGRIYDALDALVNRGAENSFVVIEEPRSEKFVQFGKGRRLGMDVPFVELSTDEAGRAYQFFQELGVESPREYDAPDPKTGRIRHGATFYRDFGQDVKAAASAALLFFVKVCGFPPDVELSIREH